MRLSSLAAVVVLGLSTAGCSFSYKLGSLFGDKEDEKPEYTQSSQPRASAAPAAGPADADLGMAKAAAAEALSRGGKDISVPWENPRTGARGTVTPIAISYTRDGFVCHDFLASVVQGGDESWLQGEACRVHRGRWEVRTMKPLKR
ncbi:MAG TPA: RT0821/Lpp0805 family surface protein [Xanthobacteraceae bacterium]|nr:RT0821/Lpp0805 family surface protein [Xanthobacteraceae bacterium]